MIKVVKPGNKIFHAKCSRCGCEFTYELNDLHLIGLTMEGVNCPECDHQYMHTSQSDKLEIKPIDLQPPFWAQVDCISNDTFACLQGCHEWECCGMSTAGIGYRCRRCGIMKQEPLTQKDYPIITLTNSEVVK